MDQFNIVVWDIETHSFHSNEGFIISSAIKPLGRKAIVILHENLGKNSLDDKSVCVRTKEELEKADIIITFYGLGFDLKMLNSRLLYWKEEPLSPKLHIDLYRLGKRYFNTHRRSLAVITEFLGIKGKNHVDIQYWKEAAWNGNEEAISYIVNHMIRDVGITEKLFYRLKRLIKSISLA